jgi:hypothetical protein
MQTITTIGLDIAKWVSTVIGIRRTGHGLMFPDRLCVGANPYIRSGRVFDDR